MSALHAVRPPEPPADAADCGIAAFAAVQADPEALAALRKDPGPPPAQPLPANFLRYADDQTTAALAAVLHALHGAGLRERRFTDWGVVAAPRFPGRLAVAAAHERFHRQGAPGASPLIVPYHSQHSMAAALSLALRLHGPSHGAGGGRGGWAEGLLTALALFHEAQRPPGVWLAMTQWDPEPIPDQKGRNTVPSVCRAAALALVPLADEWRGPSLRLTPADPRSAPSADRAAAPDFRGLFQFLADRAAGQGSQAWSCPLDWGAELVLTAGDGATA